MANVKNWAKPIDGISWKDKYGISSGYDDLKGVFGVTSDDGDVVYATYVGSGAITLSNYNGLPTGSVIFDTQAFKIHLKTGDATWKSSAAFS